MWYMQDDVNKDPPPLTEQHLPSEEMNQHFLVANGLPTLDRLSKLIPHAKEQYRQVLEIIETHPIWNTLFYRDPNYKHTLRGRTKNWFLHWMEIIRLEGEGNRAQAISNHRTWKMEQKKKRSRYRQQIKSKNTSLRKKAKSFRVWLPKESEWSLWKQEMPPKLYQSFHTCVKTFRSLLSKDPAYRGCLQYIPKRTITYNTRRTLITNMFLIERILSRHKSH